MVHVVSSSDLFRGRIICIIASGSITLVVQVAKKMEIKRSIQQDLQQSWHSICLVYLIKEREVCGKVGVIDALLHLLLVLSRERKIWQGRTAGEPTSEKGPIRFWFSVVRPDSLIQGCKRKKVLK